MSPCKCKRNARWFRTRTVKKVWTKRPDSAHGDGNGYDVTVYFPICLYDR